MCDYSLHAVKSRPARQGETIITTKFDVTSTKGMAAPDDLECAVCMKEGTEVAFEQNAIRELGYRYDFDSITSQDHDAEIGDRFAKFVKIDEQTTHTHHDALEFANGVTVKLHDLASGQLMTVVQLPAPKLEVKTPELQVEQIATSPVHVESEHVSEYDWTEALD